MKLFELLSTYTGEEGSWSIEFNPCARKYMSIFDYLMECEELDPDISEDFIDDKDRGICIKTNSLYELTWYNQSPVGAYTLYASSLSIIEQYVQRIIEADCLTPRNKITEK